MRSLALALGLASALAAGGQQHAFRQLTTRDGLVQSQVRAMAHDADGGLWFGTLGGACRFDGLAFSGVAVQDGLPDAQVSAIACDAGGALWLGSGNAVVRVEGRRLTAQAVPGTDRGARVLGLVPLPDGRLLIGLDGGGVHARDAKGIRPLEGYPAGAPNVRALLLLKDGSLLVGHREGLLHCADGRCRAVPVGDGEPKLVSALAEAADGSWWVGTLGSGLYRIGRDGAVLAEYDEEDGLLQNNVRCLLLDGRGRLWIGSKLGLNLLDGPRMRAFTVHQGLPNDNIQCAFQDREGNLWFGTDGAGALRYLGDRFVALTIKDGLCSDQVMSITPDARGDLWLGTYDNGVCRLDGMAMITTLDGLPNNTVWCGLADADGSLWFGTSEGLARVVDGTVARRRDGSLLAGIRVFALHRDSAGILWCGTRDGLYAIPPGGPPVRHEPADGPAARAVRAILPARGGGLELAGDEGYRLYRSGRFTRIGPGQGLSDATALCMLHDRAGRTWVGTANGLTCLLPAGPRAIRFAPDFGSNYIDFLQADAQGAIWAGTNNGLFRFDPDSLLADPAAHDHITLSDGLRGLEFNLNAGFAWTGGRMLFGSATGLVLAGGAGTAPQRPPVAPGIRIRGVRSFLEPTAWEGQCDSLDAQGLPVGLHVAQQRNHLTFDYAAAAFSRPEEVRYRYRLLGLDTGWLPPTDARFASYGNLPHGAYTFEVMAAVGRGPWSAPAAFSFRIDPPFWARWWFLAACGLVAGGGAYGVHRLRALRRQRREKTRQLMLRSRMLQLEQQALNASMNRHFVFNALNSIQYHINRQDRATASRYLTSFAKLIRRNLDAGSSDSTTLAEELERLELYLELEHMRFKDKFRYTIAIGAGVDAQAVRLPVMMLQPYVENSIWHGILPMAGQGHVAITAELAEAPGRVAVRIEDDGIGVEQSQRAKAIQERDHISRGIEITKGRADVLRRLDLADIRIDGPRERRDASGERLPGTVVRIELPIGERGGAPASGLQTPDDGLTFDAT